MAHDVCPYRVGDVFTDDWGVSRIVTAVRPPETTTIHPSIDYTHPALGPQTRSILEVDRYVREHKLYWSRPMPHHLALPLGA